jgi:hypothetical protein
MSRPTTHILREMFSPRSALMRTLALLTPVCMVWVFAACVSLCSEHEAVEAGRAEAHSVSAPQFAEMQDCCPAGEASCGVPADRATFVPHLSAAAPASDATAVPAADFKLTHPDRGVPPDWPADPPFERLRTLRI